MKILCPGCGQRYDELLNGAICPHCGRYNDGAAQPAGAAALPGDSAKTGQAEFASPQNGAEPPVSTAGPLYPTPAAARPVRSGLVPGVVCGVLALLLLLEALLFPAAAAVRRKVKANRDFVQDAVFLQQVLPGEAFTFGLPQRQVTVGQAQRMTGLRGVTAGYTLVRVWYQAKKVPEYMGAWEAAAYLEADGVYYRQMDRYELERVYPELAAEAVERYDLSDRAMTEGWLYFVAPKGLETATLWLQNQKLNKNYDLSSVEMQGVELQLTEGSVEG